MMIVDVAKFFIEQGSQIMELVDAFVQSVSAIAAGSVGKVAEMIERALSLSVPLLIGMFTSLLGLGDLAAKVRKIFTKIKDRVTGAVDGFIKKAGAWFKDKKGRRKERKAKKDQEKGNRPSKLETGKKGDGADSDKGKKNKKDKKDKDKDEKEDKDKRNDKQKKTAFDAGMKKGAAVVNNENLSNQEIKVELNQLELKYKLKELDGKLTSEKEDLQTWILSGKLDTHKGSKTIERKPAKAESEEDVSEEDRKLHERIAAEVKAKLEAKGKSTEGVETFEEFYGLLQSEAVLLQKKYQPQLRKGIKIAVDLVNSVKQDEKDGDVDIDVRIAPNDTFKVIAINFIETTDEDELAKITPDDRFFIEGVQDKVDTILIQNTTEVEGKNNASKAIFDTIQTEVQILVDEYKLDLKYGDISMKLLGGGDDRRLNFIRAYTKDQKEIIVNLGHVKVDLKKSIKDKEDKEAKGKLIPKMQPYREDVWTKGPHLDIVRADNNSLKITEALLDIRSGQLIWIRFGDMGGATSSDLKAADRVIKGLLKNTSIMTEAKGQAFQALEEMKAAINSNRTSKKKLQQAQRGKEKFTKMLKLL